MDILFSLGGIVMGSIVNAVAIVIGGFIGIALKKGIHERVLDGVFKAIGISVIVIGFNGLLSNMAIVDNGLIKTSGELLLIFSLVLGALLGELIDIDRRLNNLSSAIEKKFHLTGFANSFVNATLLFCVGAMAIIGSINDGLLRDPSVLYIKSLLDGITSIIFGATLGMGVIFAAIPVLIYQGTITVLAGSLSTILVGTFLNQICMVGYALVICVGLNFIITTKIKVANLLPALLIPIIWQVIMIFL